jgi:hypothetical protein
MMKNDKITGTQDFMEFDLSAMSLDQDDTNKPQASILGKMYSSHDSISTQHHAGKSRAPQTTKDNELLEVMKEEMLEIQQAMILHTQSKGKLSERKNTLHIANLDTNSILQQIRARKEKNTSNQRTTNDTDNNSSMINDNDHDDTSDNNEENYHDSEEHIIQIDFDDNKMDYEDDSTSNNGDNDESTNSHESNSIDTNLTHEHHQATSHEQISQSLVAGNEPPTPTREGGRG